MRLFISYARVDKIDCAKIAQLLESTHDIWFDDRIRAGENWWEVIVKQIMSCDGFVLLISPDSLRSKYCNDELNLARALQKPIFPVLITPEVSLPDHLSHLHYADLSRGLSSAAIRDLLSSFHVAERRNNTSSFMFSPYEENEPVYSGRTTQSIHTLPPLHPVPSINPETLLDEVSKAVDGENYEKAIALLREAKDSGVSIRFIDLDEMLYNVEKAYKNHEYLNNARREYRPIVSMIRSNSMQRYGCEAFMRFAEQYPDYDPDNVRAVCNRVFFPLSEWCHVPAGEVTLEYEDRRVVYHVDDFKISKYPVTNEQFHIFAKDPEGYRNSEWWQFSHEARLWHEKHVRPLKPKFAELNHPRENVCWYEAMAYCHWLTAHLGIPIMLPTEEQWQRAAQGDDGRQYPWGNRFDRARCNSAETKIRATTPVNHPAMNISPYGVVGMSGNVWEWCLTGDDVEGSKVVKGGAFISPADRCTTTFRYHLNPLHHYATIGFRVVTRK